MEIKHILNFLNVHPLQPVVTIGKTKGILYGLSIGWKVGSIIFQTSEVKSVVFYATGKIEVILY